MVYNTVRQMGIAQRLRDLRNERGWSQYQLAARTHGITRNYIGQVEAGRIERPHPEKLQALARALDVGPQVLYEAAGYPPYKPQDDIEEILERLDWDVVVAMSRLSPRRQRTLLPVIRSMMRK